MEAAWAEIRSPSITLSTTGTSALQIDINLPKVLLKPDASGTYLPITAPTFDEAGMYEIYYYTSDTQTHEKTPMMRGVLYRNKTVNSPPGPVSLVSPADGTTAKTGSIFQWMAATDGENNPFTYTLEVATDSNFTTIVRTEEEIPVNTTYVPDGLLVDGTP